LTGKAAGCSKHP